MSELENIRNKYSQAIFDLQKAKQTIDSLEKENTLLRKQVQQVPADREKFIEENNEKDYEVEKILNHKVTRRGRKFLIRWKGFGSNEDLWLEEDRLNCPSILKSYLKSKNM